MKETMIHANNNDQCSCKSNIHIFAIPSSTDSSQENFKTHGVERGTTSDAFFVGGGGVKRAVWEFEGKYIIAHQFYRLKCLRCVCRRKHAFIR